MSFKLCKINIKLYRKKGRKERKKRKEGKETKEGKVFKMIGKPRSIQSRVRQISSNPCVC